MNIGISFFLLAGFERLGDRSKTVQILSTFGAAPLFFYILHLYVLLLIYSLLIAIFGPNQGDLYGVDQFRWVWVLSIILSMVLYFPTKAFAKFKKQSQETWIRYF